MKYQIKLVTLPNQILRTKSQEVPWPLTPEDEELVQKMIYHVDLSQQEGDHGLQPAVGVAAIQYGIPKRVFYINTGDANYNGTTASQTLRDVFINPKIIATSDADTALASGEGCLSVKPDWPKQDGLVHRKYRVVAEAYSYFDKQWKRYDLTGYPAIVFQHEFDHCEGKLFIDHIRQKGDVWEAKPDTILLFQEEK
ncbi:peptide deformylase [Mycoplasmopsis columbinasalis]|uniref:Peptide deformylase n=1 Tax=Mycoplasmopsis columbinasalis TaxID=114880 RepID=A0A449BAU7_9BACT|nr:peptide deformylase [Mycoplasmopsis columbinasalis]VEU78320.1 peptide deformylase [Mycoplasmopsis columbinasalis]